MTFSASETQRREDQTCTRLRTTAWPQYIVEVKRLFPIPFSLVPKGGDRKFRSDLGKELLTALMLEGKVSGEGLDGFEEEDDMITSMIRELLEQGKVGESAHAIWASLACEGTRLDGFGDIAYRTEAHDSQIEIEQSFEADHSTVPARSVRRVLESNPGLWSTYRMSPLPVFTSSVRSEPRRTPNPLRTRPLTYTHSGQLSLFELPSVL